MQSFLLIPGRYKYYFYVYSHMHKALQVDLPIYNMLTNHFVCSGSKKSSINIIIVQI